MKSSSSRSQSVVTKRLPEISELMRQQRFTRVEDVKEKLWEEAERSKPELLHREESMKAAAMFFFLEGLEQSTARPHP